MLNNIKKGLVLLGLALVYISGSAAKLPPEHAQNQGREVGNVPNQPQQQLQQQPAKEQLQQLYGNEGSPPLFKYKQRKDPSNQ